MQVLQIQFVHFRETIFISNYPLAGCTWRCCEKPELVAGRGFFGLAGSIWMLKPKSPVDPDPAVKTETSTCFNQIRYENLNNYN